MNSLSLFLLDQCIVYSEMKWNGLKVEQVDNRKEWWRGV